jgi:hypothetical protein
VALGAAAAVVVLCALLMTRLPSALALAAAPGTWACGGELQIWATTVPVDFELYVSRDGWWETDDGVHRGTWRLAGGEVEITSGGATNVVPATLGVGASTDQRISHPQGMSMAMQVEAAGIDVVRVRVGTANLLQGDYSCRKVSNGTPGRAVGVERRADPRTGATTGRVGQRPGGPPWTRRSRTSATRSRTSRPTTATETATTHHVCTPAISCPCALAPARTGVKAPGTGASAGFGAKRVSVYLWVQCPD